jgi:hypothetical protein
MSRTKGPGNGAESPPREAGQQQDNGDIDRTEAAEQHAHRQAGNQKDMHEFAEQTGYRPSVNQNRHEPMPASRHDERRQEAVVRNEEQGSGQARPATPSRRAGRRDRG